MAEKPILFNPKMVRAILAGRKIVTRRLVNPKCPGGKILDERPPYQAGDILYVRETWRKYHGKYYYKANECPDYDNYFTNRLPGAPKWHPSIHMPKEAARIWLKVKDIRLEQLKDITINGLQKEGIMPDGYLSQFTVMSEGQVYFDLFKKLWNSIIKKKDLPLYGWDANPWVWVIEFERI